MIKKIKRHYDLIMFFGYAFVWILVMLCVAASIYVYILSHDLMQEDTVSCFTRFIVVFPLSLMIFLGICITIFAPIIAILKEKIDNYFLNDYTDKELLKITEFHNESKTQFQSFSFYLSQFIKKVACGTFAGIAWIICGFLTCFPFLIISKYYNLSFLKSILLFLVLFSLSKFGYIALLAWIFGFVCAVKMEQSFITTIYYIFFAIIFLPSILAFIGAISGGRKRRRAQN